MFLGEAVPRKAALNRHRGDPAQGLEHGDDLTHGLRRSHLHCIDKVLQPRDSLPAVLKPGLAPLS
jgi:hypothetical protein